MKYTLIALLFISLFSANALAQTSYKTGQKIKVKWHGQWFDASILEVGSGTQAGKYKIRYDGYNSSWDEYVGPDRMWVDKPQASSTQGTSAKGAAPASATSPVGHYVCQSYNWQTKVLDTQDEFVLNQDGTYQNLWHKQSGRWSQTGQQLQFTGVLNNKARAEFHPGKHKGMIIFSWGGEVKLDCYRQSK